MALSSSGADRRSRVPGRVLGALLFSVAVYYAVWGGEYSAYDLYRLREQAEAEDARFADLRREIDSLHVVANLLESDPATIERVARERFGMIRSGEVLYRFVEVPPTPAAPRQTASRTP